MQEYPSKKAEAKAVEEDALTIARLILDVWKNPTENGIIIEDERETNEESEII